MQIVSKTIWGTHYSDITWASRYLKSPATKSKTKKRSLNYWLFVRGIDWWPVESSHKGPVMQKAFPCNYAFTVISSCTYWLLWRAWKCIYIIHVYIIVCVHPNPHKASSITNKWLSDAANAIPYLKADGDDIWTVLKIQKIYQYLRNVYINKISSIILWYNNKLYNVINPTLICVALPVSRCDYAGNPYVIIM